MDSAHISSEGPLDGTSSAKPPVLLGRSVWLCVTGVGWRPARWTGQSECRNSCATPEADLAPSTVHAPYAERARLEQRVFTERTHSFERDPACRLATFLQQLDCSRHQCLRFRSQQRRQAGSSAWPQLIPALAARSHPIHRRLTTPCRQVFR